MGARTCVNPRPGLYLYMCARDIVGVRVWMIGLGLHGAFDSFLSKSNAARPKLDELED